MRAAVGSGMREMRPLASYLHLRIVREKQGGIYGPIRMRIGIRRLHGQERRSPGCLVGTPTDRYSLMKRPWNTLLPATAA